MISCSQKRILDTVIDAAITDAESHDIPGNPIPQFLGSSKNPRNLAKL